MDGMEIKSENSSDEEGVFTLDIESDGMEIKSEFSSDGEGEDSIVQATRKFECNDGGVDGMGFSEYIGAHAASPSPPGSPAPRGSHRRGDGSPAMMVEMHEDRRGRRSQGRHGGSPGSRVRANIRPQVLDELYLEPIENLPAGAPFEKPLHAKKGSTLIPLALEPIKKLPVGAPLERPRHAKRKRTSSPSTSSKRLPTPSVPPAPSVDDPAIVLVVIERKVTPEPLVAESSSHEISRLVESTIGSSGSATPPACPRPRRPNRDSEYQLNYGSEPDTDDSADEGGPAFVPRSLRMLVDTPEDAPVPLEEPAAVEGLLPHNFYNFEWTAFPNSSIPPESRREPFLASDVGPTTPCVDPYDTFTGIWDRQFMEHIASETNKYAELLATQLFENNRLQPTSRICEWKDTTADELYVYFAIVLAMGIVVKSRVEEYWVASNNIMHTPGFSAHMNLRRFQLLSKCLHFNDNEGMCALNLDASEAKLYKIQPVLSHLNKKFQSLYNMRQNIVLDESLLQWKGWLDINQFIPNKAAAVGIRTFEVCESQTGYLWRFEVHAHGNGSVPHQTSDPMDTPTPAIVLRLIQGLENKGYTLWMDSYYNSPALARRLKTLGFDCVGTLRTNRQFVPDAINNLTKANMRPGETAGFTSGDVDLMVWRDLNRVATISTYHGNATTGVDGKAKPITIADYNVMMGGIDKKDQMLSMYPIERKRTRIWYKKFFKRLLNVSVLNSYILVKQSSSSLNHRSFRMSLIKSLLEKHSSCTIIPTLATSPKNYPKPTPPTTSKPTPAYTITNQLRFEVKDHHLAEYPFLPGRSQRHRRSCSLCKKRVHLYCVGCDKAVCMNPCFVALHS